jgi:hypothetical protein
MQTPEFSSLDIDDEKATKAGGDCAMNINYLSRAGARDILIY